jgi:hypothetical protein
MLDHLHRDDPSQADVRLARQSREPVPLSDGQTLLPARRDGNRIELDPGRRNALRGEETQ